MRFVTLPVSVSSIDMPDIDMPINPDHVMLIDDTDQTMRAIAEGKKFNVKEYCALLMSNPNMQPIAVHLPKAECTPPPEDE